MRNALLLFVSFVIASATSFGQKADKLAERDAALRAADQKARAENMSAYEKRVKPFLEQHCVSCHGPKKLEADLSLDLLDPDMKDSASGARWAVVREKLTTGEMPPPGADRPDPGDVESVVDWIRLEMKRARRNFTRRVQLIHGNKTPHAALFDKNTQVPLHVPRRIRRISPEIYESFRRTQAKGFEQLVGNPLTPDPRFVFKDMGTPQMDVPTTSQLLRNAMTIINRQTGHELNDGKLKALPGAKKEFLEFMDESKPLEDDQIAQLITMQFQRTLGRSPGDEELDRFVALVKQNVADAGRVAGIRYSLAGVFMVPTAVFRYEVGENTETQGSRFRLSGNEIAYALSYALTDTRPPEWLLNAARDGNLSDRAGVVAAIEQIFDDEKLRRTRILRFFHEFFEYPKAVEVFKNPEDFRAHNARVLVSDTDNLVNWILERDKDVLRELLTTEYAFINTRYDSNKKQIVRYESKGAIHQSYSLPPDWKWTDEQPVRIPGGTRAGLLTQPSWLVAWSVNEDNHAILRGKWVRERLLGNVVPDIPITVDAQLPEAPEKTLRERMHVTREEYCWQCHKLMNAVGLPFENFDHFGRWRAQELGRPVDASGGIDLTGDDRIDGVETTDAVSFVKQLAASERVEEVFIRHVFRYFTGRNENEGDAGSLQDAVAAYRSSGGSFRRLVTSILTSDSFLYRTN